LTAAPASELKQKPHICFFPAKALLSHWLTSGTRSANISKVLIYQRFVGDGSRRVKRGFAP
jgi:hypothetical protein